MNALLEHVLALVRVSRYDVSLKRLEQPVESLSVCDRDTDPGVTLSYADVATTQHRYVHCNDHGAARFYPLEICLEPRQLLVHQVTQIGGTIPEHVVQHDVMHRTPVERVVRRAEMARKRHGRPVIRAAGVIQIVVAYYLKAWYAHRHHAALVFRKELEVIVHDVAAGQAEGLDPEVGYCPAYVGYRLLVEPAHLVHVLYLDIGQYQEGVSLV
jgi:hypothetical protein